MDTLLEDILACLNTGGNTGVLLSRGSANID